MNPVDVLKQSALANLSILLTNKIEIVSLDYGLFDDLAGNQKPEETVVWSGFVSLQARKYRGINANPSVLGGNDITLPDYRAYLPWKAFKNGVPEKYYVLYRGTKYSADKPPVDVGGLGVYWELELTGPQSEGRKA